MLGKLFRQVREWSGVFALFVALGTGGAYAADQLIGPEDIGRNAVLGKHIAKGNVKKGDLKDGAVVSVKLADGSITTAKIADDQVTGAKIAEATLEQVPSASRAGDSDLLDSLDSSDLQKRIADGCDAGSAIRAIGADGTTVCEADDTGAGGGPTGAAGGDLTGTYPDPQIAANAVGANEIAAGSVGSADINTTQVQQRLGSGCAAGSAIVSVAQNGVVSCGSTSPIGAAAGDLTGTYPNPTIAVNAVGSSEVTDNSLGGTDVNELSLDAAIFTRGNSGANDSICNPDDASAITCASTSLSLPRSARVLLIHSANWGTFGFDGVGVDDVNESRGSCALYDNGALIASTIARAGERQVLAGAQPWTFPGSFLTGTLARSTVTAPLPGGNHDFSMRCAEEDGDINFARNSVSAVMLGN